MRSFGIGCFHFGVTESMPRQFTAKEYIDEIENSLAGIDNISDIDIYFPFENEFEGEKFHCDQIPNFGNGEEWFPYVDDYEITFSIYLPRRVQCEIFNEDSESLRTGTENFRIILTMGYYSPVTFVEPLGVDSQSAPSDAVVLIRRYLERELKKQKDSKVKFENIGPSPFHANFFVKYNKDIGNVENYKIVCQKKSGYDKIEFHYKNYETEEEATNVFFEIIKDEMSLYYYVIREKVSYSSEWSELMENFSDIIDSTKKSKLCKRFFQGQRLWRLYDKICSFKAEMILGNSVTLNCYNQLYETDGYFDKYTQSAIREIPNYPINEFIEILYQSS